jgi:hypothetical protein
VNISCYRLRLYKNGVVRRVFGPGGGGQKA